MRSRRTTSASRCSSEITARSLLLFFFFPLDRDMLAVEIQDILRHAIGFSLDRDSDVPRDLFGRRATHFVLDAILAQELLDRRLDGRRILRFDLQREWLRYLRLQRFDDSP